MSEEQVDRRIEGTPRVRVTRRLMPHVEQRMGELFDVALNRDDSPLDRDALGAAMRECDVLVPTVTDRIDADLIESAGEDLRLIANFGAGVEHIDLAAARKRGIMVTNTPGVFTDDTADLTMGLIIGVPRRMREGVELVRSGEWTGWAPCSMLGFGLRGKCLAIVGMGRIGQAVAHRARAFGLEIAYHNRKRLPEALENMLGATYVDNLDDLMRCADILSLHAPGGEETHHLIDARRIGLMKPGSCLINTARGDLVDQDALIEALEDGRLGGAGLDVYPEEPKIDPRLLKVPNVLTLPHLASATVEGREASGEKVIANIRIWADGHRPPDQVLEGWV
ncbi:MAG: D-glycerate dehydrogenase [Sphingomonadales bacterium CG12_big_fil_rev_8_21_14_0_65_65_10]|uniref:D-glycerate dehydrogenase n=1 Tax=Blastomonas marina TaxID=1867408 RepID=A0ABQ1FB98_9SPHN|nr:D-glycerate dehydrogenase [Blastomonas marina]PIW54724.1 MAG: D-glycerate dehydrogenase [Sphingomonadales bacterium CG12_big_fil_rev_8_21_14_0_65_65_10]GGA04243.1 D-glycerate dehydrogenase [Blastomonas marina]